jgi:hypothetical protein
LPSQIDILNIGEEKTQVRSKLLFFKFLAGNIGGWGDIGTGAQTGTSLTLQGGELTSTFERGIAIENKGEFSTEFAHFRPKPGRNGHRLSV